MEFKSHQICLESDRLRLRPMVEEDFGVIYEWNQDPEVLYYSEGDDVEPYSMDQVKMIYTQIAQSAICFIMEYHDKPIGESWIQEMNLKAILEEYPNEDCRRIDLLIGKKEYWNRGFGAETIAAIVKYGFEKEHVDMVFGCSIADYNKGSIRAFEKCGFKVHARRKQDEDKKAEYVLDMLVSRRHWKEEGAS